MSYFMASSSVFAVFATLSLFGNVIFARNSERISNFKRNPIVQHDRSDQVLIPHGLDAQCSNSNLIWVEHSVSSIKDKVGGCQSANNLYFRGGQTQTSPTDNDNQTDNQPIKRVESHPQWFEDGDDYEVENTTSDPIQPATLHHHKYEHDNLDTNSAQPALSEIDHLIHDMTDLKSDHNTAYQEIENAIHAAQSTIEEIGQLRETTLDLQTQIIVKNYEINTLQAELLALQMHLNTSKHNEQALQTNITALETQLFTLTHDMINLKSNQTESVYALSQSRFRATCIEHDLEAAYDEIERLNHVIYNVSVRFNLTASDIYPPPTQLTETQTLDSLQLDNDSNNTSLLLDAQSSNITEVTPTVILAPQTTTPTKPHSRDPHLLTQSADESIDSDGVKWGERIRLQLVGDTVIANNTTIDFNNDTDNDITVVMKSTNSLNHSIPAIDIVTGGNENKTTVKGKKSQRKVRSIKDSKLSKIASKRRNNTNLNSYTMLQQTVTSLTTQIATLNQTQLEYESATLQHEVNMKVLREVVQGYIKEVDTRSAQIELLQHQLQESKMEIERLCAAVNDKDSEICQLHAKLNTSKQALQDTQHKADVNHTATVRKYHNEINELKQQFKQKIYYLTSALPDKQSLLKIQKYDEHTKIISELQQENTHLTTENIAHNITIEYLTQQLRAVMSENDKLSGRVDNIVRQFDVEHHYNYPGSEHGSDQGSDQSSATGDSVVSTIDSNIVATVSSNTEINPVSSEVGEDKSIENTKNNSVKLQTWRQNALHALKRFGRGV